MERGGRVLTGGGGAGSNLTLLSEMGTRGASNNLFMNKPPGGKGFGGSRENGKGGNLTKLSLFPNRLRKKEGSDEIEISPERVESKTASYGGGKVRKVQKTQVLTIHKPETRWLVKF